MPKTNGDSLTTRDGELEHRKLLESVDTKMVVLTNGFNNMEIKMSEALQKFDAFQNRMPAAIGYAWGPDAPILLLDALGRRTPLPMMFVASPEVGSICH